ncbi:hypothetical protein NC652_038235 [Populus alba x Populus x berolinensis]|uniref:Uncharacterized protein n=1 Tax=Populus alba x Populus x berolinensis TaxID=444605 RepID=A0AAD6LG71_9ROSI|nr:hypothetical protein NC652_038235 [Populus alba x Populus x berolinensis]KAJ6960135.1 hypothetical protein NC653_038238 [Populus alba x Populus x berolinensis]
MARSFDSFIKFLGSLVLLPIWVLASGVCFLLEIIKLIHQGSKQLFLEGFQNLLQMDLVVTCKKG